MRAVADNLGACREESRVVINVSIVEEYSVRNVGYNALARCAVGIAVIGNRGIVTVCILKAYDGSNLRVGYGAVSVYGNVYTVLVDYGVINLTCRAR